ncbi:MAG TPA: hypothetical protein VNN10_04875 [Dehalococcoidia bacterium]|nr:hypothetical protein [Dehalococcoidia bacterium]
MLHKAVVLGPDMGRLIELAIRLSPTHRVIVVQAADPWARAAEEARDPEALVLVCGDGALVHPVTAAGQPASAAPPDPEAPASRGRAPSPWARPTQRHPLARPERR